MKGRIIIYAVTALFLVTTGYVFAETVQTISKKNEYGGKTIVIAFSPGDAKYRKDGLVKAIGYYDDKKKVVKKEYFYAPGSGRNDGCAKTISYYDSNGKRVKYELYDQNGRLLGR
jgi:hypothetical protein